MKAIQYTILRGPSKAWEGRMAQQLFRDGGKEPLKRGGIKMWVGGGVVEGDASRGGRGGGTVWRRTGG